MLDIAVEEARIGLSEGGIPVGAALFNRYGELLGRGRNRRGQENDPALHGETDAFRKAGRQRRYQDTIMVTTLAPCWYCSGLIVQFRIGTVVVGESRTFQGGIDWLRERGVTVVDLAAAECTQLLATFIETHPDVLDADIGETQPRKQVTVVDHPLVQHKLTLLRDKSRTTKGFRQLMREIAALLCYEATRDLALVPITIETPLMTMRAHVLSGKKLVFVPILRAGVGLLEGMLDLVPSARVAHIGLYREPESLQTVEYYFKAPIDLPDRPVIAIDPMLATGNTAVAALDRLKEHGATDLRF